MIIRKQVYLEKRQSAMLKRQAKEFGTTEAELIRRAIERQVSTRLRPDFDSGKRNGVL